MRLALMIATLAAVGTSAAHAARTPAARTTQKRAALSDVSCARTTAEPTGLCSPYDRDHCRFGDGSLQRGDAKDPAAPFTLRPVTGKPGVYCRYDAELRIAGVESVNDPATQKRLWDASKPRRRRN